ncbi:MAG TPA: DinB family protein [Candidatus Limnocylindrales bacterium]|nr:DinB family protein [Candidatus Limnocylindrales bacterium]
MDPLSEAFQHHTWATEQLIRHLHGLPEEALTASAAGVYGEVLATLSHMLEADARYLRYLEGPVPPSRTGPDPVHSLDELAEMLRDQAVRWRVVLSRLGELDVTLPARRERPEFPHATNLMVVQALHHGNDHRTQICTVLSVNGYAAPDLDVWSYWMDRRREPAG